MPLASYTRSRTLLQHTSHLIYNVNECSTLETSNAAEIVRHHHHHHQNHHRFVLFCFIFILIIVLISSYPRILVSIAIPAHAKSSSFVVIHRLS